MDEFSKNLQNLPNFSDGSDDFNNVRKLNLGSIYMTFSPLPKPQPIAYMENKIAILSQLQLKLKANLIRNYVNFWQLERSK